MKTIHVILSHYSRFASPPRDPIGGRAKDWFNNFFAPYDYRLIFSSASEARSKRVIPDYYLLLGQAALSLAAPSAHLGKARGHVFQLDGKPAFATFHPQDCFDVRNFEDPDDDGGDETSDADAKGSGNTRRANYKQWAFFDINKMLKYIQNGPDKYDWDLDIFADPEEVIRELSEAHGKLLFFDIETVPPTYDMTVFGYSICTEEEATTLGAKRVVRTFPMICETGEFFYDKLTTCRFLRAVARAFKYNTAVAHNGAGYDWPVLASKYNIPWGRSCADTLIIQHRLYAHLERSLGHCISLYTTLPYHKDDGNFIPRTSVQAKKLHEYNARDVASMIEVYAGQMRYARVFKAEESIRQACASISAYLTLTFTGIVLDDDALEAHVNLNKRRVAQLQRLLEILTGWPGLNTNSSKQLPHYLFAPRNKGGLGLKYVEKSEKTGKPTANTKVLYKLAAKHDIPSIPIIIAIREIKKDLGTFENITPFDKDMLKGKTLV